MTKQDVVQRTHVVNLSRRRIVYRGQYGGTRHILIINQCATVGTIPHGDEAAPYQRPHKPFIVSLDAGTINRPQTQHGSQWLTVVASRIQDNLFGGTFRLCIKSVRMSWRRLIEHTTI